MKSSIDNKEHFYDKNFFIWLLVLLTLFIFLYFYHLGNIGLIDVDEPRYAEAAREMLESKNFIVPYFNYEVRYDKPILFYWLEAFSMKLFGVNEFAARFPSLLSAFLCAAFVFYFVYKYSGPVIALVSSLILMSAFEFTALSRFSITDMSVASFTTCTIICFFLGYNKLINSQRFFKLQIKEFSLWYVLAFIFLALGVLTKGPFVLVISFLILFPFFWWIHKLDYFLKNKSFWIGFLVFLF